MRLLSSSWTFIFKVVFPTVWIGVGALLMWLVPVDDPEESPVLVFTVAWVVGSLCLLWLARHVKVVGLDGEWLWVSNFRRWAAISLREVKGVEEVHWLNIHPIFVYIDHQTDLGDRIVFIPRGPRLPFLSHPLAGELRRLVQEAQGTTSG